MSDDSKAVVLEKARKLIDIMGFAESYRILVNNRIVTLMKESPHDAQYIARAKQALDDNLDSITEIVARVYSRNFNEKNIDDFIEFFSTESGKLWGEKSPTILLEAENAIIVEVLHKIINELSDSEDASDIQKSNLN